MSGDRTTLEEKIRASVEEAFRSFDAGIPDGRVPDMKTRVSRVELRGSYPNTCLVLHGEDERGPIVSTEPLWAPDSLDWENDHGAPLELIDEYLGG